MKQTCGQFLKPVVQGRNSASADPNTLIARHFCLVFTRARSVFGCFGRLTRRSVPLARTSASTRTGRTVAESVGGCPKTRAHSPFRARKRAKGRALGPCLPSYPRSIAPVGASGQYHGPRAGRFPCGSARLRSCRSSPGSAGGYPPAPPQTLTRGFPAYGSLSHGFAASSTLSASSLCSKPRTKSSANRTSRVRPFRHGPLRIPAAASSSPLKRRVFSPRPAGTHGRTRRKAPSDRCLQTWLKSRSFGPRS